MLNNFPTTHFRPFRDCFRFILKYLLIISLVCAISFASQKFLSNFLFAWLFSFESMSDMMQIRPKDYTITYLVNLPIFYISAATLTMIQTFYLDESLSLGERFKKSFLNYITISGFISAIITGIFENPFFDVENTEDMFAILINPAALVLGFTARVLDVILIVILIKNKAFLYTLLAGEVGNVIIFGGNACLKMAFAIMPQNDIGDLFIYAIVALFCICFFLLVNFVLISTLHTNITVFCFILASFLAIRFVTWVNTGFDQFI